MTTAMQFEQPKWRGRAVALETLACGSDKHNTLVSIALNDSSAELIECLALGVLSTCADNDLQRVAILCIGHSARRHGRLAIPEIVPILKHLQSVAPLAGTSSDVLEDIAQFTASVGSHP